MLPLQQAYEVKESVLAYLEATFRFKEENVHKAFYNLVKDPENGLFKGPYISLKTPFVAATENETAAIPLTIRPEGFKPHKHQLLSFNRLSTQDGHQPLPTLLTTGTGSGKTECFLYPILDYCYQCNKNGVRNGIKVIIMYPMNALATDQAKRLAETIYNDERLRGVVTAGLFIGDDKTKKLPTTMGEHNIIENRDAIVDNAPDIVLTNFKMLDYALMQQQYRNLWVGNYGEKNPMLRFLVLDELHTYDGAQGTDVANLIRRLKLKLHLSAHHLCPIGTSATIGGGEESKQKLVDYASDVFGEQFDIDSVIGEQRVAIGDFVSADAETFIPSEADLKACTVKLLPMPDYIRQARRIWLPGYSDDPVSIGEGLKSLAIMRDLLSVTQEHIVTIDELVFALGNINQGFRKMQMKGLGARIVETLLALVGEAKVRTEERTFPMLFLQIQIWQRELSGVVRYVQQEPEFTWRNSLEADGRVALPIYFCRDCGASGWISTKNATSTRFETDIKKVNQAFMTDTKEVVLINTASEFHKPIPDYITENTKTNEYFIRPRDLSFTDSSDDEAMRVRWYTRTRTGKDNGVGKFVKNCPECNSNALAMVGGRTSTLSSVAISQIMASDFDESKVEERKVLTFTNSVQDAAHQAGFYEARTYRFLLRQSIQQYLKTLAEPINLIQLQQGFRKYWHELLPGDEYYYRFLPTDLLNKVDLDVNYRDEQGRFTPAFIKEFDLRVDWEICAEFGLMAQRGRTLEKVGSSASFFDRDQLEDVFGKMQEWLKEHNLESLCSNKERFLQFENGILQRMRLRGGIDHPYFELYRHKEFKTFYLNWGRDLQKTHFLNKKFGMNVQFPKFVCTTYSRELADMADITEVRRGQTTWYSQFFHRAIESREWGAPQIYEELITEFYQQLMDTMVAVGLLNKAEASGGNYAIRPEAIWIEPKVKHIRCEKCQSMLCVAQHDTVSDGTHCLNYNCDGLYNQPQPKEDNYYKRVYDREKTPRIYAHEHTGLLDRKKREEIEDDFKLHLRFNSVNALSATSTLEMGIDIGTLNVVGNTAIPPKPSNFLQRIGRAGRKSGSALILNYAHSDGAHDMFYFAEPNGMMEGEVQTPGCFLYAKDILRRHFFAFCIDSWTSAETAHVIPNKIEFLGLNESTLSDENFVINQILNFIKGNIDSLMGRFQNQYSDCSNESILKLFSSVSDGSFAQMILGEFANLCERLRQTRNRYGYLKHMMDELQANDPRKQEIKEEMRPLWKEIRNMLDENVIEFMTNAGLLPNYAFPETGVKLEASVFKQKPQNDESITEADTDVFELVRPASSGIRDLAPGNKFYTQKYELEISGVNTFDWHKTLGKFRYCSECDCIAAEGTEWYDKHICPKCGSPSWGGNGNTHEFLRFTSARSNMKKADAALDDRSDEREQERFYIFKHFRFNYNGTIRSYGLKNVGFGIEFCPDMELMEVNYGPQMASQPEIDANGAKVPAFGFVVCRECGKVITKSTEDAEDCHYKFCHHKDIGFPTDEQHKDLFVPTYLYHKTQTEAIKVLLPVHWFEMDATIQMFKAGIELGMRYYYQSSPDHISIDVYKEKNQATGENDNYLVMYDTIPGGTGYLSRLQDPKEFSKLITIAYEHIRDCKCQEEGKDGCYHCILSYSNQHIREKLSRERTEELFKKLVDELENWEEIEGSIGSVTQTGIIEDSELERRFVMTMDHYCHTHNGWSWAKEPDGNGYHYILEIKSGNKDLKYVIHPQYDLGTARGVAVHTIADFQVICTKAMVNGVAIDTTKIPQWALYLDGYTYHASEDVMRFYSDFEKREAIHHNSQQLMRSWIITWDDLDIFDGVNPIAPNDGLQSNPIQGLENEMRFTKNSIDRFLLALQLVDIENIRFDVYRYLIGMRDTRGIICPTNRIEEVIEKGLGSEFKNEIQPADGQQGRFFLRATILHQSSLVDGSAWVEPCATSGADCAAKVRYSYKLVQGLSELNKDDWNDFWRRYNLLQMFDSEEDLNQ